MTTFTAFTTLAGGDAAQRLADAMESLVPEPTGLGVFEIEDGSGLWEIGGYFVEKPDAAGLALLATIHGAKPFAVSKLDDRDWVAQVRRELTPVRAGRFVVHGAHDADKVSVHQFGLRIEAAMAFGTGHHGTTQGCLLSLEHLARWGLRPRNVADIGSGTGVLAMAASHVWPGRIIASDIDPVATQTARANMVVNKRASKVRCITSVGFRHESLRAAAPYDLILANILAKPLKALAPDMARFTASGSMIILSGLLNRQAPSVVARYKGHGFKFVRSVVLGEWTTLTLQRVDPRPVRQN